MKKAIQLLSLLLVCTAFSLQAQKEFRGSVTYSYTIAGENSEMMAAMMPESMIVEYGDRGMITRMEGGMMAAMMGEIVVDSKNKQSFVKKESEKAVYIMKDEDTEEAASQAMETSNVKKLKETQKILGYTCKRYEMDATDANGNSFTQIIWATPDFKVKEYDFSEKVKSLVQNTYHEKLNGSFPLKIEFTMPAGGIKVELEATDLKEGTVADDRFEIPAGYAKKDFSEMLGQ